MSSSFVLTIKPDLNEIPAISIALDSVMKNHSFVEEEILDTQLAVEEAITNVIVHGYEGRDGEIVIRCRATKGIVEIEIEDMAIPFDPLTLPEPDLTGSVDDRQIGGLGIFLIRRVMDEIVYRYENNKNILVLVKRKKADS
ncbi:ATP-binding protein [uncultured Methanoregula sp.]|uniref:ATP-binding protein n=1 Tax=uncultured Methanoregula sp. TaxID=1005933 RepID=UPI002AAA668C|nr:ATP-binding protein [uncultured Methanoregula sp.]